MMIRLAFLLVTALCVSFASMSNASIVAGSAAIDWPAKPERHQVSIERVSKAKTEARLIAIAESTYPAEADMRKNFPELATARLKNNQWWYDDETSGLRLPYALTKGAIDYYSAVVTANKTKTWKTYIEPSSKFTYRATVAYKPTFTQGEKIFAKVYVVTMNATFDASFTIMSTGMLRFQKDRTVILNPKGKVLAIFGDGKTEMPIAVI